MNIPNGIKKYFRIFIALALTLTSTVMIAASENPDSVYEFYNNDVYATVTVQKSKSQAVATIDAKALNDGVDITGVLDDGDVLHEIDKAFVYTENGTQNLKLVYDKTFEDETQASDLELPFNFEVDGIVKETLHSTYSDNGFTVRNLKSRNSGKSVGVSLSDTNPTLKKPEDFKPNNTEHAHFMIDVQVIPSLSMLEGREVKVSIPKGFAIGKDVLEQLTGGRTFKEVSVQYAGYYEKDNDKFSWNDNEANDQLVDGLDRTIITFKLYDSDGVTNDPKSIDVSIYQDFDYISRNGEVPKSTYEFSIESNMDDDTESFTLDVPFCPSGLTLIPYASEGIETSSEDGFSTFNITQSELIFEDWQNKAYPTAIKAVEFKYNIRKIAGARPLKNYVVEIPIPKGYTYYKGEGKQALLDSDNGGIDQGKLALKENDIQEDDDFKWFEYIPAEETDADGGVLRIQLNESNAKSLLQDRVDTTVESAAVFTFNLIRSDDGVSTQTQSEYNLAYNPNGETLSAEQVFSYDVIDMDDEVAKEPGSKVRIQYTAPEASYIQNVPDASITKTDTGVGVTASFKNKTKVSNRLLQDFGVDYTFNFEPEENDTDGKAIDLVENTVKIFTFDKAKVDETALYTVTYKDGTVEHYAKVADTDNDILELREIRVSKDYPIESVSISYPYILGHTKVDYQFGDMGLKVDTNTASDYNNEPEYFELTYNYNYLGSNQEAKTSKIRLIPNEPKANIDVPDLSGQTIAMTKAFDGAYIQGKLELSAYYPILNSGNIRLTSGEEDVVDKLAENNGFQFAKSMEVSGSGLVFYMRYSDNFTTYETVEYGTNGKPNRFYFEFDENTKDDFITTLMILPDLSDNSNKQTIEWKLYTGDKVPTEMYQPVESAGTSTYQKGPIPDNATYIVNAHFRNYYDDELGGIVEDSGTSMKFKTMEPSLDNLPNNLIEDVALIETTHANPLFTIGVINQFEHLGYDYSNVRQGIDKSEKGDEIHTDYEGLMSMITDVQVRTTNPTKDEPYYVNLNFTYYDLETKTLREEIVPVLNTEIKNNVYNHKLEKSETEVLYDFYFDTDFYKKTTKNGTVAVNFISKDVINAETKLNTWLKEGPDTLESTLSIQVPLYAEGTPLGSEPKPEDKFPGISQSVSFKPLLPPGPYVSDNFVMNQLEKPYSSTGTAGFAYLEENRSFAAPVLTTSFAVVKGYQGIYDAQFTLNDEDAAKIFSLIGSMRIQNTRGSYRFEGRIEYTKFNKTTRESETITMPVNTTYQTFTFDLKDDEFLTDVVVYGDNLYGVGNQNIYQLSYFLRDNQVQTHFQTEDGYEAIPDGYTLGKGNKGTFHISYYAGMSYNEDDENASSYHYEHDSRPGSSISFYKPVDRFRLIPETSIGYLSYFQDQQVDVTGEPIAGFKFVNYLESKQFKDARFKINTNGVNTQLMPLTEGILIDAALDEGIVYVRTNKKDSEYAINKGTTNILFDLDDDEYVINIELGFDILSVPNSNSGNELGVTLLIANPLGETTRDKKVISPQKAFDFEVVFSASNYDASLGMEDSPVNGKPPVDLGETHARKTGGSASFANTPIPNIPENFKMFFKTDPQTVEHVTDSSSNQVYQREDVEFNHKPEISWEAFNKYQRPNTVYLGNPKLYYVIDKRFDYRYGTFGFYDVNGELLPTNVRVENIPGKDYNVLVVSFDKQYLLELNDLIEDGDFSESQVIGEVKFKTGVSAFDTGEDIRAIKQAYLDVGYSIARDPEDYVYSHMTQEYMTSVYDLGYTQNSTPQYLDIGKGNLLDIARSSEGGVQNIATTPSMSGTIVTGTRLTDFGHEVTLSAGPQNLEESIMYVPIPKKDLVYSVGESGKERDIKSDFDMILQGPITAENPNNIQYNIMYTDQGYDQQNGLFDKVEDDLGYEVFNPDHAANYTMARIEVGSMAGKQSVNFILPMAYHDDNNIVGEAMSNVAFLSHYSNNSIIDSVKYALDLTYKVSDGVISGTVWHDKDNNQMLNFNNIDQYLSDVTVIAKDENGNVVDETKTDFLGQYRFQLPGGIYTLEFEQGLSDSKGKPLTFVEPHLGGADYSSVVDADGLVEVDIRAYSHTSVNAGYRYDLDDVDAILDDVVMWVGDTEIIDTSNEYDLDITITTQTLYENGVSIATILTPNARIVGNRVGVVHAEYSYPDGKGSHVTKTFMITVLDKYTVTYDVFEQDETYLGSLIPFVGYEPPVQLTALQEYVYHTKQPADNYVQYIPRAVGNPTTEGNYVFDGWVLEDGSAVDLNTYQVLEDVTFYAIFAMDSNGDGIADKYQVRFEYITEDGLGNGNVGEAPYVEWVTRYIDPTLTDEALDALDNLSLDAPVSPIAVQDNPETTFGYDFAQWVDEAGSVYASGLAITQTQFTQDMVFTAEYVDSEYLVQYEVETEYGILDPNNHSEIVVHNGLLNSIPKPVSETVGSVTYVFNGWYLEDGTAVDLKDYKVLEDVTFYARFEADTNGDGIADIYQVRFEYITKDGLGNGNLDEEPFVEWVTRFVDPTLEEDALYDLSNLSQTAAVSPQTLQEIPEVLDDYEFIGWLSDTDPEREYEDSEAVLEDSFTEDEVVFTALYESLVIDEDGDSSIVDPEPGLPGTGVSSSKAPIYGGLIIAAGLLTLYFVKKRKED